jgi:hypothetical protein
MLFFECPSWAARSVTGTLRAASRSRSDGGGRAGGSAGSRRLAGPRHHVLCHIGGEHWNTRRSGARSSGGQVCCTSTISHAGTPTQRLAVGRLAVADTAATLGHVHVSPLQLDGLADAHPALLQHPQRKTPARRDVLDDRRHLLGRGSGRPAPWRERIRPGCSSSGTFFANRKEKVARSGRLMARAVQSRNAEGDHSKCRVVVSLPSGD